MDGMRSLRNEEDNSLDNQETTLRVAEQQKLGTMEAEGN